MSVLDPVEGVQSLALDYLAVVFGKMSDTLPFTGKYAEVQFLGSLFEVFNMIVLVAGIILVIYHVVFGTIKTANEGKLLGERESVSIRIIQLLSSIVLLIPTATGYCLAQILFMHIVVWGVYAADNVWDKALTVLVEQPVEQARLKDENNTCAPEGGLACTSIEYRIQFRHSLKSIVEAVTCAWANGSDGKGPYDLKKGPNIWTKVIRPVYKGADDDDSDATYVNKPIQKVYFGASSNSENPYCGYLDVSTLTNAQWDRLFEWMRQHIYTGHSYNSTYYREGVKFDHCSSTGTCSTDGWVSLIQGKGTTDYSSVGYYSYWSANLDWLMEPFISESKMLPQVINDTPMKTSDIDPELIEQMRAKGWILAGNYYRVIYKLLADLYNGFIIKPVQVNDYAAYGRASTEVSKASLAWELFMVGDDQYWCDNYLGSGGANGNPYAGYCKNNDTQFNMYFALTKATDDFSEEAKRLSLKTALDGSMLDFINVLDTQFYFQDPFNKLVEYGYKMMTHGQKIINSIMWSNVSLGALSVVGWAGSILPGKFGSTVGAIGDISSSIQAALTAIIPLAYGIAGIYYTLGGVLAVYLPMLPFVIFLVASLGWLIAVVESMIAAPLVALGLIWPETQQNVLGRAEPAVMMLMNVFLRPALLVISFLAALSVGWIAINILNIGFVNMLNLGGIGFDALFGPLVMQAVYVGLCYVIVKQAFSLITQVPDKVLYWIGDRSASMGGADEALSGTRQQGEGTQSGGMQAMQGTQGLSNAAGSLGNTSAAGQRFNKKAGGGVKGSGEKKDDVD